MKELWGAVVKKYAIGGPVNQTTLWVEFIAKMLFWVIFQNYLETRSRQKAFAAFMGLKLDD